jgi:hypothetical protein
MTTAESISTKSLAGGVYQNTDPPSQDAPRIQESIYMTYRSEAELLFAKLRGTEEETYLDGLLWKWAGEIAS